MKINFIKYSAALLMSSIVLVGCSNNDEVAPTMPAEMATDFSGTFVQKDQMGRPAVNTVFVSSMSSLSYVPSVVG